MAVKIIPKFAEHIHVGAVSDTGFVGFIKYQLENNVAKTPGYNPKQNASNAPGIGSYLDLCISHFMSKNGIKYVQTSMVPSESRIHQMQVSGLPLYKKIPIDHYKRGIASRVREKATKFMGRHVEAEATL